MTCRNMADHLDKLIDMEHTQLLIRDQLCICLHVTWLMQPEMKGDCFSSANQDDN